MVFAGVVDFVPVFLFEVGAEDWVGEADFDADAVGVEEGVVSLFHSIQHHSTSTKNIGRMKSLHYPYH
jgi:hypothetical protein